MEPIIKIEMDDGFKGAFNAVRSEHENIMKRIDEIEGKLVFDHENKIKTIYGRLKSESLDEFQLVQQYHREGDEHNEATHVGGFAGLRRAVDLMEEYYPWLKEDEDD
jgi:hypothetical protein